MRPGKPRVPPARTVILATVVLLVYFSLFNRHIPAIPTSSWLSSAYYPNTDHAPISLPDPLQNAELVAFWKEFADRLLEAKPNAASIKPTRKVTQEEYEVDMKAAKAQPRADLINLEEKDILAMKQSHKEILLAAKHLGPRLPYRSKSRGIVMTAGKKHLGMAITAVRMLRQVGSELPVELFLDSWADYDAGICKKVLQSLNARCVVLSEIWNTTQKLGTLLKYQYKVFALLLSSFEEVVFLDADAFPAHNPDTLLDQDPYKSTGLVMWPDYWISTSSHYFYDITGTALPPLDFRRASESGIILYSKRLHAESLLLAAYYNYFGPDFYYPLLSQGGPGEGDKETFLHAALVMNEPFYAVHTPVKPIGSRINGTWFSAGMKQGDPIEDFKLHHGSEAKRPSSHDDEGRDAKGRDAKPFFLHNNMIKLDAKHLSDDYGKWRNETGHRVRLWGPENSLVAEFGYDVEHVLWREMKGVVCQMEGELCGLVSQILADLFPEDH